MEFHAIVAKSGAMLFPRPILLAIAALLVLLGTGGALYAQMEGGDRGILPIDSSGTLEIGGIKVDVSGKSAEEARFAGWRIAQREGFKALWARTNRRPISEAPTLSDSTLDGLVSSIVVEREQIGPNRYIAELGVLFDRSRAGEMLGVPGQARRSAPMLLIPVLMSGGTVTGVELRNPWQRAWAQFRTSQSQIDYVRVSGLGTDPLLINASQSRRPGRGWWRNILDLYGAANVLVAEVHLDRVYPGGPAKATFVGRFGPDGERLGSFELLAKDSADLPRMMTEGVQRMDELFTRALAAGIVRGDPDLVIQPPPPIVEEETVEEDKSGTTQVSVQIAAPDAAWNSYALRQIRSIRGVIGVSETSPPVNGTSMLSVTYRGDAGALRNQIVARGFAVNVNGSVLRTLVTPFRTPPPAATPAPAPTAPEPAAQSSPAP
ncbi:heavy-metal-associated domain-containing protein [Sphingomonas sp. LY160]|uniref:heavy-metal-associated domain-containing protein n=1 Tax=Sphingomonas sp. LY160 TaxID=3095342 RepID=UPI002ADED23F|nr:heavy-metal-associated domain-containing protein [Sphingomonas sp. LY160]MEA1071330.1 heavy-metal-associated domain-containing protein [Sphingomonas sp. LY160]